jgi:hypothetical protein
MPERNNGTKEIFWGSRLMWTLLVMAFIIVVLAFLALRSPISQPVGERVITVTVTSAPLEDGLVTTPEPEVIVLEPEDFLDPEEIGHTDGIILWSTVLLLIVVIATLRETIMRK